jgi:tetratricopeptide (TPR) repeat protein
MHMPFVKKNDAQGPQPRIDPRNSFIGRTDELHFFIQNILTPEDPTYNILSISGQGGVGKSTLLARFIDEAHSPTFKDYCLTAIVDERQTTPVRNMEGFADQLRLKGKFERGLRQYKETLRRLQTEQYAMQDSILESIPDFAGAAAEIVPFAGSLLREGVKAGTKHLVGRYHADQIRRDAELLVDPLAALTTTFVEELNRLADTYVTLRSRREKRQRRVLLFFDTFEQLALSAVPWLLDYFLPAPISSNVVLVIAGRDSLDHSLPDDPKGWLPYYDRGDVYSMPLKSFTEDETRVYLAGRGITDPARIAAIWQLSLGLPLYLGLLTANPSGEVNLTEDVVVNFLRWIPGQEDIKRRLALEAALFSTPFNQDDLAAFPSISERERVPLFRWLTRQPFVLRQEGRYRYHDVAQELFSRHLFQQSPKEYTLIRRSLADHYQQLLEENQARGDEGSATWLELVLAQVHQLFLLPEEVAHIQAIKQILRAYRCTDKSSEIINPLRELSGEQYLKQTTSGSREYVQLLLQTIGAGWKDSQENLVAARSAAGTLLEKLTLIPSFPEELLAAVYYARGWIHYLLEEPRQAIADFTRALDLDPNYFAAYSRLGGVYRNLGRDYGERKDLQASIAAYDRALALDSQATSVYADRGWTYHFSGDPQQAIADFDRALELDPKEIDAYAGRGWVHIGLEEYNQAIADFDRALELDPKALDACHGRGWAHVQLKEYNQAIADFDRYIEVSEKNPWVYLRRSMAYASLKNHQQALADFDRALALSPKDAARIYAARGWAYHHAGESKQALADFDRALELNPKMESAYSGRGWVSVVLKDYEQALVEFNRALDLNPNWSEACHGRAYTYVLLKEYEQAIADFDHYIEIDEKNPWVYLRRGRAYASLKNHQQTLADFDRALALDPKNMQAYHYRGLTYLWLQDIKRGCADFTCAREGDSTYILYSWRAEWANMCQQKPDSGMAERLEAIAAVEPMHYSAYVCRGVAMWFRNNYQGALTELEQAIQQALGVWDLYFWKGMACVSLEREEEAMEAIIKALDEGMPPILLTPLRWFEQERPDFYEKQVVPLLAKHV